MALGRKTGGRKKGVPNKRSAAITEAAREGGELPHEFLLRVSRGGKIGNREITFEERMAAAVKAAPYYAPRLSAKNVHAKIDLEKLSDAQLEQLLEIRKVLELDSQSLDARR